MSPPFRPRFLRLGAWPGVLALAAWVAGAALAAATLAAEPRLALVVGCADYPEPLTLPSAKQDAEAFAAWLATRGYPPEATRLLLNPDRATFLAALADLRARTAAARPSQVTLFFSGHGTTLADDDGDEGADDASDEAFVLVGGFTQGGKAEDGLLRDDAFFREVGEIARYAHELVVVLDACHAGGLLKDASAEQRALDAEFPRKAVSERQLREVFERAGGDARLLRSDRFAEKSLGRDPASGLPPELRLPGEARVLFWSAASQSQPARAGQPLSQFTAAFLRLARVEAESKSTPLSLHGAQRELTQRLKRYQQTPAQWMSGWTRETPFLSTVFPTPGAAASGDAAAHEWASLWSQVAADGALAPELASELGWKRVWALRWNLLAVDGQGGAAPVPSAQVFRTGAALRLRIEARARLWVYLLYAPAEGPPQLLYPLSAAEHVPLAPGKAVVLPADAPIEFLPPAGAERLRLVASATPLAWDKEIDWPGAGSFATRDSGAVVGDSAAWRALLRSATPDAAKPTRWSAPDPAGGGWILTAAAGDEAAGLMVWDWVLRHEESR